jgi:hypothetical protein
MVAPDAVSEEDIDKLIIPDDLSNDEPLFKAYIEAKVYDKEGHIIQYHKQPMRSLTQYFLALMSIPLIGTYQNASTNSAPGILTNVLGLPSAISGNSNSATIVWEWSIQLGSGTQAFSLSLNSLAAPIANGSGAGQLVYGSTGITYAGSSLFISIVVSNYTSSTVTVAEIGLTSTIYIYYSSSSSNTYNYLLSYDTFPSPISIPANSLASFQIVISFSG